MFTTYDVLRSTVDDHMEYVHEIVAATGLSVDEVIDTLVMHWHDGDAALERMLVWWPRKRRNAWVAEARAEWLRLAEFDEDDEELI